MKSMIIPGNGGENMSQFWYPYVKTELEKEGFEVISENMPDPVLAREKYWVPFIEEKLSGEENAILIGHSSGAIAALRYLEKHKAQGAVLIAAYHTDLGLKDEKKSGYFDRPFDWKKIKANSKWIIQFSAVNDPVIPIEEAKYVRDKLNSEYHELKDKGHYTDTEFPEILEEIKKKFKII